MNKKKINYSFIMGVSITSFVLLFILAGMVATPYDPEVMDSTTKLGGMSLKHVMGTDHLGRDILSRIMVGSKTTLFIAMGTIVIGAGIGTVLGALTGYFGGIVDEIVMRIIDTIFAFPSILLALVIIAILGPGKYNVILALGIAFIPSFARIVRSEFIRCKNMDYVKSARLAGANHLRIMFIHILPNTMTVLISSVIIGFNNAVLAEAGMSYLGIGVMPPDPSLGRMLSEAQSYIFSSPGYAIFPGLILILMILGFSLLSDGIRTP